MKLRPEALPAKTEHAAKRKYPALFLALAAAVGGLAAIQPAQAAQADIDRLKSYVGDWRGRGTAVSSATGEQETMVCRLGIADSGRSQVTLDGRCTIAGRTLSVAGTMAYVQAAGRYEAVMSSVSSFQGEAVGEASDDALTFAFVDRNAGDDEDSQIAASLDLADAITLDMTITDVESGEVTTANVPFASQ